jgi:lysophospholipase L1-like esterase
MNTHHWPNHWRALPFWVALWAWAIVGVSAQTTNRFARWEKDIAAFETADKASPPSKGAILFIGSSSIRMWKTLAQDFPDHRVLNRGFGGSEIEDSAHFADRIVFPYQPRLIVLYAGGNDINAKKTPERVFGDFKAFVARVQATLPETRIAYISIAPNPARWSQIEQIKSANRLIEEYTRQNPRLAFINVFPHMLGEDGKPKPDIYLEDKLHMNANGYAIWKKVVGEYLKGQ